MGPVLGLITPIIEESVISVQSGSVLVGKKFIVPGFLMGSHLLPACDPKN